MKKHPSNKAEQTVVVGPPGTGKTHTLIHKFLKEELFVRKTKPENILVTSFGNAAVDELKDRIESTYPGVKIQIKTLHSFGVQETKLDTRNNLLKGAEKWRRFKNFCPIAKDWNFNLSEDKDTGKKQYDEPRMKVIDYARNKLISVHRAAAELGENTVNTFECQQVLSDLESFKQNNKLFEYVDMIRKFIERKDWSSTLDVLFLDEAQDLNPLQWKMVEKLESQCSRSYIAGDDDQSIYAFQSASPEMFIKLKGKEYPLIKSVRVPKKIHKLATNILKQISNRRNKNWNPKEEEGRIEPINNLDRFDFTQNEYLILFRNNWFIKKVRMYLFEKGIYFKSKVHELLYPPEKDKVANLDTIKIWERLNKGAEINLKEAKLLYKRGLSYTKGHVKRGFAQGKFKDKETFTLEELKKEHGLLLEGDWDKLNLTQEQIKYITTIRKTDDIYKDPRIELSTIHSAKGGESENVILYLDMLWKTRKGAMKSIENRDTEYRVWFVGVTRSAKNLFYLKQNRESRNYFRIERYI